MSKKYLGSALLILMLVVTLAGAVNAYADNCYYNGSSTCTPAATSTRPTTYGPDGAPGTNATAPPPGNSNNGGSSNSGGNSNPPSGLCIALNFNLGRGTSDNGLSNAVASLQSFLVSQ